MYVFLCVCVCSEQPQVHFRIRNRQTGLMMAVTGDLDDVKLMRIQETEESGELDQIWFYHNGRLHCKVLPTPPASRGLQENRVQIRGGPIETSLGSYSAAGRAHA